MMDNIINSNFRDVRLLQKVFIISALMIVSACSTAITAKKPFDKDIQQQLEISQVSVDVTSGVTATPTLVSHLKSAILQQLSSKDTHGKPARIDIVITYANIIPSGKRALIGALAGSNQLYVTASIISQTDEKLFAEFEVKGEYNPGAFGALTDPEKSTAEDVAKALVKEIYKN